MPINSLYNAAKLREFTSAFKRHTIKRVMRPKNTRLGNLAHLPLSERIRGNPSDYFHVYCRMILPQIEAKTEERLLSVFLKQISNEDERREVELAYH